MTTSAGAHHEDVAVYQACQKLTKDLDGLTLELEKYSGPTFEAGKVDFPSHFRDRATALKDQVNQLVNQLAATADTSRADGLIVKKKALGHQLQRAMKRHRDYREGQIRNDLRNIWPDMTVHEVEEIVRHHPLTNVYQLAASSWKLGADEVKDAIRKRDAVQKRSEGIHQIERDMVLLAELFKDLETIVIGQEAPIESVEKQAEVAEDNARRGTSELGNAVASARAARKKRWYAGTALPFALQWNRLTLVQQF